MSTSEPAGPGDVLREVGEAVGDLAELLLDRGISLEVAAKAFETRYIKAALERHGGSLSQAAAALGIHRNTLRLKLQRNGVGRPRRPS